MALRDGIYFIMRIFLHIALIAVFCVVSVAPAWAGCCCIQAMQEKANATQPMADMPADCPMLKTEKSTTKSTNHENCKCHIGQVASVAPLLQFSALPIDYHAFMYSVHAEGYFNSLSSIPPYSPPKA
jgi:hypothetical protein